MFSLFPRLRQLLLPGTAQPNDPAYIAGPDLPPCMQSRYSSATFFRPPNTVSLGISGPPYMFRAQRKSLPTASNQFVEEGFLVYDGGTVCGFVVTQVWMFNNLLGSGSLQGIVQHGNIFTGGAGVSYGSQNIQFTDSTIEFGLSGNPTNTPVKMDGVSAARGLRALVQSTAASAAIGIEAVALTGPAMTFYNGRAYEVLWAGNEFCGGVASNFSFNRVRQNNLGGALLVYSQVLLSGAGAQIYTHGRAIIARTAGTDLTDNLVLTSQASAGTVTWSGAASDVRYLEVRDVGAAADYPNAISI